MVLMKVKYLHKPSADKPDAKPGAEDFFLIFLLSVETYDSYLLVTKCSQLKTEPYENSFNFKKDIQEGILDNTLLIY